MQSAPRCSTNLAEMEFRRINSLPPYVFTIIDSLKIEARRAGEDVIDLGFGNPDLPSPDIAVEKLSEAAHNSRNHRYSASRGIPKLREAIADYYQYRFGVTIDPETEVISTIGAKEGFSHLMWTLLQPGDAALVPSPSYPIHIYGPLFAGADIREVPLGTGEDFFDNLREQWEYSWPKPRVIVMSFPHNPTTTCVDLEFMQKVVDFARERDVVGHGEHLDVAHGAGVRAHREQQHGQRHAVPVPVVVQGEPVRRLAGDARAHPLAVRDERQRDGRRAADVLDHARRRLRAEPEQRACRA